MLNKFFRLISPRNRILNKAEKIAYKIDELKDEYRSLTDDQLKSKTSFFIKELEAGKSLDDIAIHAFATIREAVYRENNQFAYLVQLVGAYVVYQGDFAEMMTGEGKTLTLFLAAYVNALEKKGVHIVTVNEYLAQRDAELAGRIFARLDMTVGCNTSNLAPIKKKEAFACDITYTTNSELGFDYLRDNMVGNYDDKKIRGLHYAIVDEGDSVLIDEARTPLIISGQPKKDFSLYFAADKFVSTLHENDYKIDEESRSPSLTESGIIKAENFFKVKNLFNIENSDLFHKISNALTANKIFENGKEYIVKDNQILIVDHFTGRILEGRSYNSGLHQAVQAKERVPIEPENVVVATITYQSFFRLYKKLAAVSGTALTESEEFLKIYNLVVVPIPTNKPVIRIDHPDHVFGNANLKWQVVVKDISEHHAKGQPILVGTASVEDSEILHNLLREANIPHEVLNAKNHAREAEIISNAGQKGAVTISTNMAGRGTDIKLGEGVLELGGLYVIGTERHESRRIDNQLRGRAGRQGDVGESRFFISFSDSLFKRFAQDKIEKAIIKLGDDSFDSNFFSRMLDKTQKKVESINFDVRKNLIDYDHVLSSQRELIYKQRDKVLLAKDLSGIIQNMQKQLVASLVEKYRDAKNQNLVNHNYLSDNLNNNLLGIGVTTPSDFENLTIASANEKVNLFISDMVNKKINMITPAIATKVFKDIIIQSIDNLWIEHLDRVLKLREGVSLRSLEQTSPLNIYVKEADILFNRMLADVAKAVITNICQISTPTTQINQETLDSVALQQRAEALEQLEIIKRQQQMRKELLEKLQSETFAKLSVEPTPINEANNNNVEPLGNSSN
ncbi:preprotein translocase subunit SecA [Mycoplasmoides alvi]|uniref:preprotein translocase subunit SecA n=1 Tax=Mycoplasmoides alvi TaxID=78580 RepID=UPI0009FC7C47|nr:preprotein translocase subunit SecA [Mycoplasmoides alvi]